ncbi:hypothetical protein [Sulfurovum sp. AR]|uniref:hypothetical protein n=1 Tax=Sulfurovum sp. AR TaxID=1165841 RepID=UPI00025C4B88|nr:hypothetical protein [Sulfurovum sp. AR]EIF51291.1 hypothetical protein SULAR_03557 [Sulfurovum sp. AR]
MLKQLLWLTIWGVVFGYMEAAVVVYLRDIYYPEGFSFPLVIIEDRILLTELLREAATLLLIWVTVSLAYNRLQSRFAAFFLLFGLWDIFYYIFLKLLLDWPESLNTWDILFLIPAPWVGPVWAPVLVSIGFVYAGTTLLFYHQKKRFLHFDRMFILFELFSALLIIVSFMIPGSSILDQNMPTDFPWILFLTGFLIGTGVFLYTVYRSDHADMK